jgi:hypothetical protein
MLVTVYTSKVLNHKLQAKMKEWLQRYLRAELLGTFGALMLAWFTFDRSHSYIAATVAGLAGEGFGFYGYFIVAEIRRHGIRYKDVPLRKRLPRILAASSTNLFIEFAPAEVLDNLLIRPLAMYIVPQHVRPYAAGFIVGKVAADLLFYALAIAGYEARKRWLHGRTADISDNK